MDGRRFRTEPWMASPKMPTQPDARAGGLSGKVLSFGYFSLHQQRKVTRRQAKASSRPQGVGFQSSTKGIKIKVVSRSRASSFLLLAQKKRTKENGLPRQGETATGELAGILRLAIHGSIGKRPPSMAAALRVFCYPLLVNLGSKINGGRKIFRIFAKAC